MDRDKFKLKGHEVKSEIRNPKSETTPKAEARRIGWQRVDAFGFRASDFGFRISNAPARPTFVATAAH